MSEPNNGQALSTTQDNRLLPKGSQSRYTGETLLRTRPRTYRKVVMLLADPDWSERVLPKPARCPSTPSLLSESVKLPR